MKKFLLAAGVLVALLCAAAALSVLAGCTAREGSETSDKPGSGVSPSQESSGAAQLPDASSTVSVDPAARLPLENYSYRAAELQNYCSMGAQFYTDHMGSDVRDVPYDLAAAIYKYRDYHNALIFDTNFTDILELDPAILIEIAASQAPHIDLYSDAFANVSTENEIKKFFVERYEGGQELSLLSYGEDVRAKAAELFGDSYELPRADGLRIRYNAEIDLYYLEGPTAALSTDYPVVVEWKRIGDSYTAKIIRLSFWEFRGSWSTPDGSWESSENCSISEVREYVNSNFHSFPQDTYVLTGRDRQSLRVIGYKKGV